MSLEALIVALRKKNAELEQMIEARIKGMAVAAGNMVSAAKSEQLDRIILKTNQVSAEENALAFGNYQELQVAQGQINHHHKKGGHRIVEVVKEEYHHHSQG